MSSPLCDPSDPRQAHSRRSLICWLLRTCCKVRLVEAPITTHCLLVLAEAVSCCECVVCMSSVERV